MVKFFVSLDETNPAKIREILKSYGYSFVLQGDDDIILEYFYGLKKRILNSPSFNSDNVMGVSFSLVSKKEKEDYFTLSKYFKDKKIPAFLALDDSFLTDKHSYKVLKKYKPIEDILEMAKNANFAGIKLKAFIYSSESKIIRNTIAKSLDTAKKITKMSLVPLLEIEIDSRIADRMEAERKLAEFLLEKKKALKEEKIALSFSLPLNVGTYDDVAKEESVNFALGYSPEAKDDSLIEKYKNENFLTPTFTSSSTSKLNVAMSDNEFNNVVDNLFSSLKKANAN